MLSGRQWCFSNLMIFRPACEQSSSNRSCRSGDRLVVERRGQELTLPLRRGVKWHDGTLYREGRPMHRDLLLDKSVKSLGQYVKSGTATRGGHHERRLEVTFRLKRRNRRFLANGLRHLSLPCQLEMRSRRSAPARSFASSSRMSRLSDANVTGRSATSRGHRMDDRRTCRRLHWRSSRGRST